LKLARDTLLNLIGLGAPLLVAVVSIPELIRHLGEARFGMLALIWAVTSYFGLFDLGLGRALTQQLAIVLGERRDAQVGPLSFTALSLMALIGCAAALILFALAPAGVSVIRSLPDPTDALHATWVMALALPAIVVTSGLRGMLEAQHAFAIINAIRLPMGVWTFAGPWLVVLWVGADLTAIAVALALGRWLAAAVHAGFVWRGLPQLRGGLRWAGSWVRPLATSGGWLMVSNLVSPLLAYVDRFVIGACVSAAAVAYYTTPQEILTKIWIIPGALTSVLFPMFALLIERRDPHSWALFDRAVCALFFGLLPLTTGIALFSHELLSLWLRNPEFVAASAPVMQIFTFGILLSCLAHVPVTWLQSSGNNRPAALVHLGQLALYAPLIGLVATHYGLMGAAWVWLVRISFDSLAMFWLCHRRRPAPGMLRYPVWLALAALLSVGAYAALSAPLGVRALLAAVLLVGGLAAGLRLWKTLRMPVAQPSSEVPSGGPLVTLVTPVYNQEAFVEETVRSVLAQRYPCIEYIVIDDGSTDGSLARLRQLEAEFPGRFQLLTQPNAGQAATLNRGWALARGEVLAYLSSDDRLHPDAVSRMVEALQAAPDVAVAYCDFSLIDAAGQRMVDVQTEDFSASRLRDHLVCQPGPGAFFRREVFESVGGWDAALRQVPDFEFWLRASQLGPFLRVPLVLADYRVHDESASFRPMPEARADEIVLVVRRHLMGEGRPAPGRFAMGMALVISAMNHAQSGRARLALARLGAGLRACPPIGLQLIVWRRLLSGFFRRSYYRLGASA
jgi:O-antigen/teichoic acid export membrane protein/GT2 family glycosyltransferase